MTAQTALRLDTSGHAPAANRLHCGDNLAVLRAEIPSDSVDLIYLDPPFNTERSFGLLFKRDAGGRRVAASGDETGFADTWRWDAASRALWAQLAHGTRVSTALAVVDAAVGQGAASDRARAYVAMMAVRILELHRVLKPTGSIFCHCDTTASHYLRILLDGIFGYWRYRGEIAWKRTSAHANTKRRFGAVHDTILIHGKGDVSTWHHGEVASVVDDIKALNQTAKERTGYPTQKPLELLRRLIRAASDEGDVVLDPFCGSGTTLSAARELGRRWIGIDANAYAIAVAATRLAECEPAPQPQRRRVRRPR